jgi:DNA-binding transcriptional MerR regulator
MQKTVQQIPLNFGEEPEVPPPAAKEDNGTGDQHEKQYMAAAGVVVRVKSYKNQRPAAAVNAELFSADPALAAGEPIARHGSGRTRRCGSGNAGPRRNTHPRSSSSDGRASPEGTTSYPRRQGSRTPKAGPSKRGRKSLKQVAAEADLIDIPTDEVLFSKQYYTMGEVSEMFRVNQSLLRFWETEFDILQPKKNKKGDRYFRPVDIKNLHLIYHLLRQKKYTIEGAKDFLRKNKKADERFEVIQRLQQIKSFLLEWKAQL